MIVRDNTGRQIGRLRNGYLVILAVSGDTYSICNDTLKKTDFIDINIVHRDGGVFELKKEELFDFNANEDGYRVIEIGKMRQL